MSYLCPVILVVSVLTQSQCEHLCPRVAIFPAGLLVVGRMCCTCTLNCWVEFLVPPYSVAELAKFSLCVCRNLVRFEFLFHGSDLFVHSEENDNTMAHTTGERGSEREISDGETSDIWFGASS